MERLTALFERLAREQAAGFAAFITAGDPNFSTSLEIAKGILQSGVDLMELGMPFSDPMAEGVAIQASSRRALAAGTTMAQVFDLLQQIRAHDKETPIILMGYYNPIFSFGEAAWVKAATDAGADGAIIVDLPPEESESLEMIARTYGFNLIRLIAPTSEARLPKLLKTAQGFLYYVSITGTTGAARPDFDAVAVSLRHVRAQTQLPIALGFGIKTPEDSKRAAEIADMVVVGSALVEIIARGDIQAVKDFVAAHKAAIASVKKEA